MGLGNFLSSSHIQGYTKDTQKMSCVKAVVLPKIGSVKLIIKTKREIRAHPAYAQLESHTNEWWYWNRVWDSEVALSEWLLKEFYPNKLSGRTVLELGCGTGLAGMVAAKLGGVPTFSDKVFMVMDSIKEACKLNRIVDYRTRLLDWARPQEILDTYDVILGSEIFYDRRFLEDLRELLKRVLTVDGRGVFCDPNRLGIDTLQDCFLPFFRMKIQEQTVRLSQSGPGKSQGKPVFIYEVTRKEG